MKTTYRKIAAMNGMLLIFIMYLLSMGCATTTPSVVAERVPLGVTITGPVDRYSVEVSYITQDDTGVPTDYHDISGQIIHSVVDGHQYYRWETYRLRAYKPGEEIPGFVTFEPAVGFEYFFDDLFEEDMGNLPDTSSLPRNMGGFEFHLNVIDFHMWDTYIEMFFGESAGESKLEQPGDESDFDLTDQILPLGSWENVSKDLEMTAGVIHAEYVGDVTVQDIEYSLVHFRQEQTLKQTVVGLGMEMPYEGTNRFYGLMYLYDDGTLARAWYREYVYGKVYAPMNQTVIVHNERRYAIDRVR
jgi:hypothetical protein